MLSPCSSAEQLLAPRHGPGVCPHCLNLIRERTGLCRACRANERHLTAVLPLSYSVGGEWLHRLIAAYKRGADPSVPDAVATLARLCDRFVAAHESCLAEKVGTRRFELVTTVPSGNPLRDSHHPLRRIVGELMEATRDRHERVLVRTGVPAVPRRFDAARYRVTRPLAGAAVLLIDDMWTSGASAESAAAALLEAGAGMVAAIVIARHLNRNWYENDPRLRGLMTVSFDQGRRCALCDREPSGLEGAAAQRGGGRFQYGARDGVTESADGRRSSASLTADAIPGYRELG